MSMNDVLVHFGALIFLFAFMVRDQLLLRGLIVIGTVLYVIYYFVQPEVLWAPLAWNLSFILINIVIMGMIYFERARFAMTPDEARLYECFTALNPGEFRKLMKIGEWLQLDGEEMLITAEGEVPEHLYYVLDGEAKITRGNRRFSAGPRVIIGELAFLMKKPASADVHLTCGVMAVR
ncbi:MAG: hypothetical protein J4F41_04500, partial [Alphaproteobacteria bacterium]|nr:hypothetical protein [Alphaproteobacteria bacterium]